MAVIISTIIIRYPFGHGYIYVTVRRIKYNIYIDLGKRFADEEVTSRRNEDLVADHKTT